MQALINNYDRMPAGTASKQLSGRSHKDEIQGMMRYNQFLGYKLVIFSNLLRHESRDQ